MVSRRNARRRIEDALAVASPLALADAMDAHICSRPFDDLRGLIERSAKRMDQGDRRQLDLYLNLNDTDDLLGHRFIAFLRQNPRAIAALDADAADAILAGVGELPRVEHPVRRLPARAAALLVLVLAIALLPLAAQYAHQRGLLQGLTDPLAPPPIITPFVQPVGARTVKPSARPAATATHFAARARIAHHGAKRHARSVIAHHGSFHKARIRYSRVAWKFSPANNPYFNRERWHYPYREPLPSFSQRAQLSVRSYLYELAAGNVGAALAHLGLPAGADRKAIAELPIISRRTTVSIVGSKSVGGREKVEADIQTEGREYYEIFFVARDGPATRIVDRYYIPVNHRAQVAMRSLIQNPH